MTRRARVKYLVDLLLIATVAISITTGVVKIPELTRYFGRTGLVLPYNTMSLLHDTAGVVLALLVLVHLALGWHWLATMTGTILRGYKGAESVPER